MKADQLATIKESTARLITAICLYQDCSTDEFIDALIGIAWSEEEAGDIKRLANNEEAIT